ncbi:MAG: PC4/YdbC family ssDNA-binding protein [Fusobacterium sp. JB021]|nr:PC4/YdbC family ssDNA-binding protein [Fusobacterium sp. JB020]MDP0492857.1 PC4/YdbC family ssDNA-binding protein [Fusobacterium sp. JB021]MDP0506870.1 PC4/YdbC family ssDNA-binding protein [Fusobacterium sp. JB019]
MGIKFDFVEKLGNIGQGSKGWKKEVNLISWNSRKAKLDIRDWDETHEKMGKGLTLSKEEAKNLRDFLNAIDLDSLDF